MEPEEGVVPHEVKVKEVPDLLVASITRQASLATVGKEVQEGFVTLMQAVGPVGYGEGMPGVMYHDVVDEWTDATIEVFVPVAWPFEPPEGVEVRTMPGGTVAFTIHRGPYEECGRAYQALTGWIQEHEHEMAGPPSELYLNDPREVGMDEALTEIRFPIR